eukprot:COSAG02_NODE_14914_length_1224_cov_1.108444_2_plen_196_part_01
MVEITGGKATVLGERVMRGDRAWKRERTSNLLGQLRTAGAPAEVAPFPPISAFDDQEFEMRTADAWLAPLEPVKAAEAEAVEFEATAAAAAASLVEAEAMEERDEEAIRELTEEVDVTRQAAELSRAAADKAFLAGKVGAQYVQLSDGPMAVIPCDVLSWNAASNEYEVSLNNGGETLTVPRVGLCFDGEAQSTFI